MKKIVVLLLTFILSVSVLSLFTSAADTPVPAPENYKFNIASVDGKIKGEDGIILTSADAVTNSGTGWCAMLHCKKISDNVYQAKADAKSDPNGKIQTFTFEKDDIVIGIHSDGVQKNKEQRNYFSTIKKGSYITLQGVDLAAKTVTGDAVVVYSTKAPAGVTTTSDTSSAASVSTPESSAASSSKVTSSNSASSSSKVTSSTSSSSKAASSGAGSSMDTDDGGMSTTTIIIIVAAAVVVIGAVAIVLTKKKK